MNLLGTPFSTKIFPILKMLNCFNIIDQTDNKNIKDIISLTYDQRFIRRKK